MQRKLIFSVIAVLSVMALPGVPSLSTAARDMPSHPHGGPGAGGNPLIEEMLILDDVFRRVVSAVSLGQGEKVHAAVESLHGTMEKTHKGVHEGTVKIPKNSQREKEFVELDKAFHEDLERLADAGRKNDQNAMLLLTKKLLDGCVNCHSTFRK